MTKEEIIDAIIEKYKINDRFADSGLEELIKHFKKKDEKFLLEILKPGKENADN